MNRWPTQSPSLSLLSNKLITSFSQNYSDIFHSKPQVGRHWQRIAWWGDLQPAPIFHAARITKPTLRTERERVLLRRQLPLLLAAMTSQTAVCCWEVTGVTESTSTDATGIHNVPGLIAPTLILLRQNLSVCSTIQQQGSKNACGRNRFQAQPPFHSLSAKSTQYSTQVGWEGNGEQKMERKGFHTPPIHPHTLSLWAVFRTPYSKVHGLSSLTSFSPLRICVSTLRDEVAASPPASFQAGASVWSGSNRLVQFKIKAGAIRMQAAVAGFADPARFKELLAGDWHLLVTAAGAKHISTIPSVRNRKKRN